MLRWLCAIAALGVVVGAVWLGGGLQSDDKPDVWIKVAPDVYRTPRLPAGYALVDGEHALLFDAPEGVDGLRAQGVKKIDAVLLTHHHRDTCAAAGQFLKEGVTVRAAKTAAEWLTPDGVNKYWKDSLPLRSSRTAYLVLPVGLGGVDCSLVDGQKIDWRGWSIQVLGTPGHSRDHLGFLAARPQGGSILFCGDALAAPGKLWTPYTTDWDHWTDAGLTPTAQSLRKLAGLKPSLLLPAHGEPMRQDPSSALLQTAAAVEEMAFLKSFERFTRKRLGNAPEYRFLAKEQAESNGSKPWSQVSEHLFITGNTYVLTSKENAILVLDPWGERSAEQIAKLKADRKLGALEVVMFSHAHYDHYDGIYYLPDRDKMQVWTLDQVAIPIAEPSLLRAPFLDARPVKIDRRFKEGETAAWREYRFRFHHLPGQSEFTMGVEATIDGKRCFFTADNWFHQDQFSGSGGWMGLNRSYPLPYAASAQKVLDAKPEWVLAEHGGPFEFSAEDFRRRVEWGKVSAHAADALCASGNHRRDWDPHRIHVEPVVQKAKPGATIRGVLVVDNPLPRAEKTTVTLHGRGFTADQTWELDAPAQGSVRREISLSLSGKTPLGRQVFVLSTAPDGADGFVVLDVEP